MKSETAIGQLLTPAWLSAAIALFYLLPTAPADAAGDADSNDAWEFKAELYGWLPTIEGGLLTGDEIELDLNDIFDNLDMTFMGVFQARKGDWALVTDLAYLKLSGDHAGSKQVPIGPIEIPTRVGIEADVEGWLVNLAGAYRVHQADKFDLQLLAGARYLSVDVEASLDTDLLPGSKLADGRNHTWDAIVGVRGLANLSGKWWLAYRYDIGTGNSDLTWNAVALLGRRFDWGSLTVGYRYLHYDFDSDWKLLEELDVYGPVIGAAWEF